MSNTPILYTAKDGIARITLNRPNRLNALTREMMIDLGEAVHRAVADGHVRVILLRGSGRAFCAGQDLSERDSRVLKVPLDLEAIQIELYHPLLKALKNTSKPVVACVGGVAAGAGVGLALAADITLAGASAKFSHAFVKVGLSVDAGLGYALTTRLGPARARAILMLGETFTGQEAAACGLIWKCVSDEALIPETDALLDHLRSAPVEAIAGIKAAVAMAASGQGYEAYLSAEAQLQGRAGVHNDYAEGVLAFLQKRPAEFGKGYDDD